MVYHPRDVRMYINSARKAKTAFISAYRRAEASGEIPAIHEANRLRVDVEQTHEELFAILRHPEAAGNILGTIQQLFDSIQRLLEGCPELDEPEIVAPNEPPANDQPANPQRPEDQPEIRPEDPPEIAPENQPEVEENPADVEFDGLISRRK